MKPGNLSILLPAAALLLAAAGCVTPTHVGEGDLERAFLPPGFEPIRLHVSPAEKYVLCESDGPGNPRYLYNSRMNLVGTEQHYWESFAFGPTAELGVCITPRAVELLDVPEMRASRAIGKPRGLISKGSQVHPLPSGEGWLVTSPQRGPVNLWLMGRRPPRFAGEARSSLPTRIRGAALDNRTGLLVLTGEKNQVEVFDLQALTSKGVFELPCREVSASVVAKDGWAWVGTRQGTVIPISLKTGRTAAPIQLGGPGDVELALSESSGILAAMVQDRSAAVQPFPTHLKVYIVGEGRLVDIASAFFETRGTLRDVVVIESTQLVVFACGSSLLVWEYREER